MQSRQFWLALAIVAVLSFLGGGFSGISEWAGFTRASRALYAVDGDTVKLGTQSLRLVNIDAPEVSRPGCPEEAERARAATERLRTLLDKGQAAILPNGRLDRYGRPLVRLTVDGRDVGDLLIAEGLAKPWPVKGEPGWCPAVG
jgi:endonuclease YncB( thermonuclease family)